MRALKVITTVILLLFTVSALAQTKEEALEWMRGHLKVLTIHNNDSILPYRMTKTYTFYDDAFTVKTAKNFYKDTSLNSPPAFSKIWYKDIFMENDSAVARGMREAEGNVFVYTIWAAHVYSIIGREDAPLPFWRTFNEPMGLDLYFPEKKGFGREAVRKLYRLASLMGAKEKPRDLNSEEDALED